MNIESKALNLYINEEIMKILREIKKTNNMTFKSIMDLAIDYFFRKGKDSEKNMRGTDEKYYGVYSLHSVKISKTNFERLNLLSHSKGVSCAILSLNILKYFFRAVGYKDLAINIKKEEIFNGIEKIKKNKVVRV